VKDTKSPSQRHFPCGRPRPREAPPLTESKIDEYHRMLRKFLSEKQLKYSEQRWQMAKLILETGGHLDATEMIEKVRSKHPSMGAATIYRNIKVLCDAGIMQPTHQNMEGRDVFELSNESHHDHILCLDCGEVFEFNNSKIETLQDDIAESMNFQPKAHRHVIQAHCIYLKEKQKSSRKKE
jgi:Fur family ferric uptake transcriptional regulator